MIYIGKNNKNTPFLISLEEELNTTDNIIVDSWEAFIDNDVAWLKLNSAQEAFYNNHPDATLEEVYNKQLTTDPVEPDPEPTPELDLLLPARQAKLEEIKRQDEFSNKFFISVLSGDMEVKNQELWIDKDLRNSLYGFTLPALQSDGEATTKQWTASIPPQSIDVSIVWALEKLPLLEIYAKRTYDLRASNEAAACAATTVEERARIDVKANYPLFLTFELNLDNYANNNTETVN